MTNYANVKAMGDITISRAEPADLDEAWAIVIEYYDAVGVVAREDRAAFSGAYFGEGSGFWLARDQGDVTGCIALRTLEVFPRAGEVKRLYVKPAARGRGIAGLLLDALQAFARASGYEWLYLDSKDDLDDAIRFYEKRGYRRCARYNDNPQATMFMNYRCLPP
jgi:ribosomal protein S18 acetylase RimI-like enzyme